MEDELILSEEDRLKLDEIVSQMIQNNESDESIKFVIEDFKSKYGVKKKRFRFTCSRGSYGVYYRNSNNTYFFGLLVRF